MAVPGFGITAEDFRLFHNSLVRCEHNAHFFDLFYYRFLKSSPEVRAFFDRATPEAQKRRLRYVLYMFISAACDKAFARRCLVRLGEEHRRMGVTAEHYELWLESLLPVVRHCDPAFTPRTELAWCMVLRPCIEILREEVHTT